MILAHLELAKEHVAEGEEHIRRQHQMMAELERDGHDITMALEVLNTLEQAQALHLAGRDRLTKKLWSRRPSLSETRGE